jgi:hypothetical protein
MANLLGQNIGTNYKGILNLGSTINTPVSGTLQAITDGDGLASALNVSTTSVAVSGTLGVTAGANFAIASGNVGIGTSGPSTNLEVRQDVESGGPVLSISNYFDSAVLTQTNAINFNFLRTDTNTNQVAARIEVGKQDAYDGSAERASYISFQTQFGGGVTERMRILAGGGLTFNGDTAAANALDDYEEGTWTIGVTFGGASVGVTTSANTGTYTKIGRQVTVNGYLALTSKGSSTGAANVTGLPFTIANTTGNYSAASLAEITNISFADMMYGYGGINTTTIVLKEVTNAGAISAITNADFANNSEIIVSLTYFV